MTTQSRPFAAHPIGATGSVTIRTHDGDVTIWAVDGDIATVRAADDARDLAEHYRAELDEGRLRVVPRDGWGIGFGRLFGRGTPSLIVEVPRGVSLEVTSASGSISVDGIVGPQRYRSASGDAVLAAVSGRIRVEEVSGDVTIRTVARSTVSVRTVSGAVDVAGAPFDAFEARVLSGDLRFAGQLDGPGPFSAESVSGSVTLVVDGPVRVEGTTVSGEIRTDLPHTTGGLPGRRSIEIGTGGPRFAFRTVSGDLEVVSAHGTSGAASRAATAVATGATTRAATVPVTGATIDAAAEADDPDAAARLAILRDLELGRIDVEAASERLRALDEPDIEPGDPADSAGPNEAIAAADEQHWDHRA